MIHDTFAPTFTTADLHPEQTSLSKPAKTPPDAPSPSLGETAGRWREPSGPYQNTRSLWGLLGVLSLVQAADVLLATSVLNELIEGQAWVSWLVAVCVAVAASVGAFLVGRERQLTGRAGSALALWVSLGATMAALRILEPLLLGDELEPMHLLTAALLLALYLLTGHAISSVAYRLSNPKLVQLRAAERMLRAISGRLGAAEARLTRLTMALTVGADEVAARGRERDLVIAEASAGAKALKHRARLLVAEIVGRPDTTSVYRQPLWVDGSDEADQ